jgi:hypothetical protein
MGCFGACQNAVTNPQPNTLTVYESCGGHFGYIRTYVFNGKCFERIWSSEGLSVGDGAPDSNNEKLQCLFRDCILSWEEVPNNNSKDIKVERSK